MEKRKIGWYRDHGGTGVYRWWNGRWWSACAHQSWDAETAAKQAQVRSDSAPIGYTFMGEPKITRGNPREQLRQHLALLQRVNSEQQFKIEALERRVREAEEKLIAIADVLQSD